jgi:APA family basic amino acid/polyamine antiporter
MTHRHEVPETALRREVGPFGAVMLGLGAMVGTGVYVSIGLGAGLAGPAVVLSLAIAAGMALCNGLSSAQLAAVYPVSGGTYEYGYRLLRPWAGFTAGVAFIIAKSASAATAALGFSGYLLQAFGYSPRYLVTVALVVIAALTALALTGIRQSNAVNIAIVAVSVSALLFFVAAGSRLVDYRNLTPFLGGPSRLGLEAGAFLEATALMFVAYTGYARIATLGEEVLEPRRTIPRAIIRSILLALVLYSAVAVVAVGIVGSPALQDSAEQDAAPLALIAAMFSTPFSGMVLVVGALAAMLGVLLNLLLGLSRVVLAMARRRDLFTAFARVSRRGTPHFAVLGVAVLVAGLTLIGSVKLAWSFSAFSVLIYYAITNVAAWRLAPEQRLYPRWVSALGFASCLSLAFWIEWRAWAAASVVLLLGLCWHWAARRNRMADE